MNREVRAILLLTAASLLFRLPALRALPLFGDEAIHLHWAHLIAEHPLRNAFISLQDPKPPFHFWLLALFLPISSDPVWAGRLLSVAAGAASVPLFFLVARSLWRRIGSTDGQLEALAAALLFVSCPFLHLYQRMALAESLFTLETLCVLWLSIRLASATLDGSAWLPSGANLGIAMGVAMLTRQNFSYALWALPPLVWLTFAPPGRRRWKGFCGGLLVAVGVAFLIWAPMLVARIGPEWRIRVFHVGQYRETISMGQREQNALEVLRWLSSYETPPVLAAALLGLVWFFLRNRRAVFFLAGWLALMVLPLLLFASLLFPRYFVGAALPIALLAGGFLIGVARELVPRAPAAKWTGLGLAVLLCGWPMRDVALSWVDSTEKTLVAVDRWQYVIGWPAGGATEAAARFVAERSRTRPILLLTPEISGNPTDGLWVLLRHTRGVTLRGTPDSIDRPVLVESSQPAGLLLLRGDIREMKPPRFEQPPPGAEVDLACPDPILTRQGSFPAESYVAARNPGLRLLARFENPRDPDGRPAAAVLLLQSR